MTFFVVTRAGRHVIHKYLASWGGRFLDDVRVLTYGALLRRAHPVPATYVFADLERLAPAERRAAAHLWERLASAGKGHRLVNHPERSLRRYDLLRALHEDGVNRFRAWRAAEWPGEARYPVFLRREGDHAGPRTPLLWDRSEVERALAHQRRSARGPDDWIVVEFEDCADDAGYYRKYSCFRLEDALLPRHVFFSRRWVQKLADLRGGSWVEEELAYLHDAPHADRLLAIFERAGIRYGRIDYSVGKHGIQVWEINTNPIILDAFDRDDAARLATHQAFAARWDEALARVCARTPAPGEARLSPRRLAARVSVAAEAWKETRAGRRLRRLKHRALALGRPGPLGDG